mmetsp:Transcript_30030/g.45251  ORF Transcript_30030/g.45251 Transcript_30030/m.45251 type:complete len:105 (+) Transcript_30030:24-338(+)
MEALEVVPRCFCLLRLAMRASLATKCCARKTFKVHELIQAYVGSGKEPNSPEELPLLRVAWLVVVSALELRLPVSFRRPHYIDTPLLVLQGQKENASYSLTTCE